MNRRQVLSAAGALALAPALPALADTRTRWSLRPSEGFDALCFLGPLSGKPFYAQYYEAELAAFKPRMPAEAMAALMTLHAGADAAGSLLGPGLCAVMSGGPDASLDDLIAALDSAETVLLPPYRASPYWDADGWKAFMAGRPLLRTVLTAMRAAEFGKLRQEKIAPRLAVRVPQLRAKVSGLDVIAEQERLLGHRLEPTIDIILLWFSKPHGIRIQGQRFLSHVDYPDEVVIRIAAHEILHPPFPMQGPAAKAAYSVLGKDALLKRIIAEHDHAFGYNDLEGVLNEDTVQALDQIVSERLGFGRDPAKRWAQSDDGMHVLAAGLYGLLKADGYDRTGGKIADWMTAAARSGKLAPARLHAAASAVLGVPTDKLWPRVKAPG